MGSARRVQWWRSLSLVALVGLSLLGQGERCEVDPRFLSPSATLATRWNAIRSGDAEAVWECYVDAREDLPLPGMLWFLPPVEQMSLGEFHSLPVTGGRVFVSYEVSYVPQGMGGPRSFRVAEELVRLRGAWRIARPIGEASMPDWEPVQSPIAI